MKKKQSSVFRIQLTADAKDRVSKLSDKIGVTQIALTSRLAEWFALQPETVQAAILGLYPESIKEQVATLILRQRKR